MLVKLDQSKITQAPTARSFAALMDLYEYNYLRLRRIAPDLTIADKMVSTVPDHNDLYLNVNERCKYTTLVNLTYQFGSSNACQLEPDLHLKVYHDAQLVEVLNLNSRSYGFLDINNTIDQKWRMNRFLYKWLGYCLYQGHYFQPMRQYKTSPKAGCNNN
ncbi:MAG: DUF1249 domain-containing protein [Gammaproteobacteria bacterium]|nr:DUF1249 domain-containing protein [Gammaproteobacteria bacterium]